MPPTNRRVGRTERPKPATKLAITSTPLAAAKCSAILAISEELARLTGANAESLMSAILIDGVTFVDSEFCSNHAAVPDVNPAGILNGITATPDGPTLATTVQAVLAALFTQRPHTRKPVVIMSPATAGKLAGAMVLTELGTAGVAVVTTIGAGASVIAIDASAICYNDDGGAIDVSREAAVQMDSAPDNPATAATVFTSLWPLNLVGFRLDRFVSWQVSEANAVAYAVAP